MGRSIYTYFRALFILLTGLALTLGLPAQVPPPEVGVEEHLGSKLPLDLVFHDEDNQPVRLGDLLKKPTILTLVYFRCPGICTPILEAETDVLDRLPAADFRPGEEFQAITISFDPNDTPDLAKKKKANFFKIFKNPFPEKAWRWLTGDQSAIDAITRAVGFKYVRQGGEFAHPGVLTIVSPEGMISRYIYGSGAQYLPADVRLALNEAKDGRTGASINKAVGPCVTTEQEAARQETIARFGTVKFVSAMAVIFLVVAVALFLFFYNRKKGAGPPDQTKKES